MAAVAVLALLVGACAAHPTASPGDGLATPTSNAGPSGSAAAAGPAGTGSDVPSELPPSAVPSGAGSATPLASPDPTHLPAIPAGAVPILYYHRVQAPPADYLTWSKTRQAAFIEYDAIPNAFAAQLDWLAANGYTTILPRDLAAHWDLGSALPAKPVVLTFDDGWHDWVSTVLPMLQSRGMVAEFYLTLAAIADGNISWPEVQTLAAAGSGIGAHDVHHVQLAELGQGHSDASPATMWAEVNGARQAIGEHIGIYPDSMAYVGGGFSPELEVLAKQAGYSTARSIRRGIVQDEGLRYQLFVVRIGPFDDVRDVQAGTIDSNLPTFVARMHGVSDRPA